MSAHVLKIQSEFVGENSILKESLQSMWGNSEDNKADNDDIFYEFQNTIKYDENIKRYEVELPFKKQDFQLSDNFQLCKQRL